MKLTTVLRSIVLTLLIAHATNTLASGIDPKVEACIRSNSPKATTIQRIKLTTEGGAYEEEETLAALIHWKHYPTETSNLLAVFDEPDDISGSRLLFLESKSGNEIYLYMPALSKVRRITSDRIASSMYGMDFSYEDFQWLYNMLSTAVTEQLPDAEINGEAMYALAMIPTDGEKSNYEKIYSYFDKKSCVIRKVEFYEEGSDLRKVLLAEPSTIKKVNGILIPHKFLMSDLKSFSETELTVISVKVDPSIPDSLFDPAQLKDTRGIE